MGNILPTTEKGVLTYSRPSKIPLYSAEEVTSKTPCLYIDTASVIKKDDNLLTINGQTYDISTYSVRQLVGILKSYGADVSCIESEDLLLLPALLLLDMSNREYKQEKVLVNPVNLSVYNVHSFSGLISITSTVTPLHCINMLTKEKAVTKSLNQKMFIKTHIDSNYVFYYYVHSSKFIWNVNLESIVTNSKEFVSKNIEGAL